MRLSASASGLYTCIKSFTTQPCIKSEVKVIYLSLQQMIGVIKIFSATKVCPHLVICPRQEAYIHALIHAKICITSITSDEKVSLLMFTTNDQSNADYVATKLFSLRVICPCSKAYIHINILHCLIFKWSFIDLQ